MQLIQQLRNCVAALLLTMTAIQVQAAPISLNFEWEEIGGGGGTASATLTVETDLLNMFGPNFLTGPIANGAFLDFEMMIGGTSDSAGSSYGLGDFDNMVLAFNAPVDLSSNLLGQAGFVDFNMFSSSGPSGQGPLSFALFNVTTGITEIYDSKSPKEVSEPSQISLMLISLMSLVTIRIKRKLCG